MLQKVNKCVYIVEHILAFKKTTMIIVFPIVLSFPTLPFPSLPTWDIVFFNPVLQGSQSSRVFFPTRSTSSHTWLSFGQLGTIDNPAGLQDCVDDKLPIISITEFHKNNY